MTSRNELQYAVMDDLEHVALGGKSGLDEGTRLGNRGCRTINMFVKGIVYDGEWSIVGDYGFDAIPEIQYRQRREVEADRVHGMHRIHDLERDLCLICPVPLSRQ